MELRPLGFGEIFDRAVTLYIRNFVPFAAIVMVLVLPTSILQYVLDRGSQSEFDALLQIFTHPERVATTHIPTFFDSPALIAVFVALLLMSYLLWPFALNAVAVGVAFLYRNRPVDFRACYAIVLRRWLQTIGLILVDFCVVLAWYVITLLLVVAISVAAALLVRISPALGFWVGLGIGLTTVVVMLPLLAPLFVALTFSMYAVVIEERGVFASVRLGFQRVFNGTEFWRATLFAIATGAVLVGGSTVLGVVSLAVAFAHLPALEAIIDGLGRAVITPFAVVLLAIYYFDVRIRREAFDVEAGLERLSGTQAA
ncbi:MAG: hypothetical protein WAK16_07265 [Candidatus Cybelea sp.]